MPELGTLARDAGFALEHRSSIGSTSAELAERARVGERGPVWLVADEQTAGKGRRARGWASPPGNLYASLLLSEPGPPEKVAQLSLVLALALHDAVSAFASDNAPAAKIKWPNDLMIGGRKCAGLLLEGGVAGGRPFVVAGFGINVVSHPEGTDHPASDLRGEGFAVERDALFRRLSNTVVVRFGEWAHGDGIDIIRADWLENAYGLGEPMRIVTAAETFEAVVRTLDMLGRLVVERDGREVTISAGEVFALGSGAEVGA